MMGMEDILCEMYGEGRNEQGGFPPGFRFHPTDEELVTFYLAYKVFNGSFCGVDIAEVDLNRCEPWELPDVAKIGEKEWYFFSLRDRKYPTGLRTNRATQAGYWKATGKDKEIYSAADASLLLGMKKTLVFYKGRAPRGEKTKWVMHEYRLVSHNSYSPRYTSATKDEWVICRIQNKGCRRGGQGQDQPSTPQLSHLHNYILKASSFVPPVYSTSSTQQLHILQNPPLSHHQPTLSHQINPNQMFSMDNSQPNLANSNYELQHLSSILLSPFLSHQDDQANSFHIGHKLDPNTMDWRHAMQQQDSNCSSDCFEMHGSCGIWGLSEKHNGSISTGTNVYNASASFSLNKIRSQIVLDTMYNDPVESALSNS